MSTNTYVTPADVTPNTTVGAVEIGALFMAFILGIMTIQTYNYYRKYPNDPTWLKSCVMFVMVCVVGHTASMLSCIYTIAVTDFGMAQAEIMDPLPLGFSTSLVFSGFLGPVVQSYFAYRIHRLSSFIYMPVICWAISLGRFIISITASTIAFRTPSLLDFRVHHRWTLTTILALGMINDVLIAGNMCYYLKGERDFSLRMGRSSKSLDKMMAYAIETGLLSSLTAVASCISMFTMPDNLVWLAFYILVGGIFANSLLASLNARPVKIDESEMVIDLSSHPTHSSTAVHPTPRWTRFRRTDLPSQDAFASPKISETSNPSQNTFVNPKGSLSSISPRSTSMTSKTLI
ncbi:hypothetical protein BJ138DRAFT_650866 [Hygrophoropsis aurantiaca]|uniref:Uncharacterized protein n=1 Tax=Hygrophoropsis aurantiaca TaxID=72124 RepID=A0ACB8A104_9AGAM|nr:hypothetical protein BJ138DRAFT_650866 [Hygrophoropsis aurantiaca]